MGSICLEKAASYWPEAEVPPFGPASLAEAEGGGRRAANGGTPAKKEKGNCSETEKESKKEMDKHANWIFF